MSWTWWAYNHSEPILTLALKTNFQEGVLIKFGSLLLRKFHIFISAQNATFSLPWKSCHTWFFWLKWFDQDLSKGLRWVGKYNLSQHGYTLNSKKFFCKAPKPCHGAGPAQIHTILKYTENTCTGTPENTVVVSFNSEKMPLTRLLIPEKNPIV